MSVLSVFMSLGSSRTFIHYLCMFIFFPKKKVFCGFSLCVWFLSTFVQFFFLAQQKKTKKMSNRHFTVKGSSHRTDAIIFDCKSILRRLQALGSGTRINSGILSVTLNGLFDKRFAECGGYKYFKFHLPSFESNPNPHLNSLMQTNIKYIYILSIEIYRYLSISKKYHFWVIGKYLWNEITKKSVSNM